MRPLVDHIGIFTDRPRATKNFYKKLGFKAVTKASLDADFSNRLFGIKENCLFEKLVYRNAALEIFYGSTLRLKGLDRDRIGINHWALQVENKEVYIRNLRHKGIRIIALPREGRFVYFVKDPNGILIEIRDS